MCIKQDIKDISPRQLVFYMSCWVAAGCVVGLLLVPIIHPFGILTPIVNILLQWI